MKLLATILFLFIILPAFSQERDTVNIASLDSLGQHKLAQVDSVQAAFKGKYDSLNATYSKSFTKLDSAHGALQSKIDSLRNLGQPADKYIAKSDSVQQTINAKAQELQEKVTKLQTSSKEKLQSLGLPPKFSGPVDKANAMIDKMGMPEVKLASAKVASLSGGVPNLSIPGVNLPGDKLNLPSGDLSLDKLGNVAPDLKGVTEAGGQIQQATEAVGDVNKLGELAENQVGAIDGVKDLKGAKDLDGLLPDKPNLDPAAAKEQAIEQVQQRAVDHFAGKQEALQKAMDQVAKYKQKYPHANSISDLTKRPPNPYKDKPFIERLVPGLALQYQRKNEYLLDVNLYSGYILSPRFITGLGWNHRFAYNERKKGFLSRPVIFGPRAFVDFRLPRGFIAHLEVESMNTFVPNDLRQVSEVGEREWVFGMMTGMKKVFRISKRMNSTMLIQYNIFDRHHKAPYADRLNSRIGIEYTLKKKVKKVEAQ